MAWLEEAALTAGTFGITLELRATNARLTPFIRRSAIRDMDRIAGYYERVEDAIRMGRDVRPGSCLFAWRHNVRALIRHLVHVDSCSSWHWRCPSTAPAG